MILGPTFELHEDDVRKYCRYRKELDLPLMQTGVTWNSAHILGHIAIGTIK